MIKNPNPEQKMEMAMSQLIWRQPFIASIMLHVERVPDTSCETAWIDGLRMGYNPAFVETLTLEKTMALMGHEAMHIGNLHHTRRQGRDHETWNTACDCVVDNLLQDSGLDVKEYGFVGRYPGLCAEEIYQKIQQEPKGKKKKPGPGLGEVRDCPGDAPAIKQHEEEIKVLVSQAMAVAKKSQGNFPGSLDLAISETREPRLDWREVLARFMDEQAKSDYSFSRPNPRYVASGFFLPVLDNRELATVHLAVDTSGSISTQELAEIVGELQGLMSMYESTGKSPELEVIYCDYSIQGVETLSPGDTPNPKGGGGTDFNPVFKFLANRDEEPRALIYMTDGGCNSFPPTEPSFPTIWILTRRNRSFKPPFGEVVTMRSM